MHVQLDDTIEMRPVEVRDAPEMHALAVRNREMLRQWFPGVKDELALEETKSRIMASRKESRANKGLQVGIWENGRLAGAIDLHDIDSESRRANVGYWLGAEFQGRGLMTRACRALLDHAFDELGLNRIEIQCAVQNVKSRAIPEMLGFIQEGVIRQAEWLYDHYNDHVIYGMLTEDWRESQPGMPSSTR